MRVKITLIFLSIILATAILSAQASAGWVDDWFTQSTYSGPGAFEGQKRGYYTAGNLSAKFPHSNDFPVTASLPKFKAGCGGIDMFMGGFSFMNMEYLGDKFQRIMTAAPTFAFDIALRALSEQFADEVSKLENAINALNKLQLDDCKAAKAVVTIAADTWQGKTEAAKEELNRVAMDTGINDLFKTADTNTKANPSLAMTQAKADITGNDTDLDVLLYQSGSLLSKAAQKYGTDYSPDWVALIRGYIGDLYLTVADNMLSVKETGPCEDNKWDENYSDFVNGTAMMKPDGSETCTQIADAKKSMYDYVRATLNAIDLRIKTKQQFTPEEQNFIQLSPVPVYLHLKIARAQNIDTDFIDQFTLDLAYAYAVKQLKDLYETSDKMLTRYRKDIYNKNVVNVFKDGALKNIENLQDRIRPEIRRLDEVLYKKIELYGRNADKFFEKNKDFNRLAQQVFGNYSKIK